MYKRWAVPAILFVSTAAWADGWDQNFTVRGADAPDAKPWDNGSSISYRSVDGKSTTQIDSVLKYDLTNISHGPPKIKDNPFSGDVLRTTLSLGGYIHKLNTPSKPQNDRGAALGAAFHLAPGGDASADVVNFDAGINATFGKTLKPGTGSYQGSNFDTTSDRQILTLSMFEQRALGAFDPQHQRRATWYWNLTGKAYSDDARGAQDPGLNGRVSGVAGIVKLSVAPFGLDPALTTIGSLGIAPIFFASAQEQHDMKSSGGRKHENRHLYAIGISFPFTNNSDTSGFVPSIDLTRTIGSDLLIGREKKNITSLQLSVKY